MKYRIQLIVIFIYAIIENPLCAQPEKKQSLSLSFYPATMYAITKDPSPYMHNNDDNIWTTGQKFEAIIGYYGYKAVGYDTYNYGAWELAYKRVLNKQFQLNLGLSCDLNSKHWDLYDQPDGPRTKRIMDYRINLLPGIDWLVFNGKHTNSWFSGQAGGQWVRRGMKYFDNNERNQLKFAWQIWFVFDRKINDSYSINLGCGYGTLGILKIGISYHY